ncbi:MAG: hypothetical protein R2708_22570 [Vicinamibacterales bacterium]
MGDAGGHEPDGLQLVRVAGVAPGVPLGRDLARDHDAARGGAGAVGDGGAAHEQHLGRVPIGTDDLQFQARERLTAQDPRVRPVPGRDGPPLAIQDVPTVAPIRSRGVRQPERRVRLIGQDEASAPIPERHGGACRLHQRFDEGAFAIALRAGRGGGPPRGPPGQKGGRCQERQGRRQ